MAVAESLAVRVRSAAHAGINPGAAALALAVPFLFLHIKYQPGVRVPFGSTHLGSIQLLARIAPDRQFAAAQGDFATVLALVMAGAMALSGVLYADLGSRAYAAMALAAAAGGAFVLLARRFVRAGP